MEQDKKQVEEPMNMTYRESIAWQKGWGVGFKAGYKQGKEEKEKSQ